MSQIRRTEPERKVYHRITRREDLITHLQWALSVEVATIPPYLCALYSIQDPGTDAAALVRSVVIEEMLHAATVSNLMNAIGGKPSLGPEHVALYPGYIPHHAAGGPFIQLQALSPALARTVFMAIEQPETPRSPAEGNEFETIGQFYRAIDEGFENCGPSIFEHDTGHQRADTYFGGGGGTLRTVRDLDSARRAIAEITEQGEGAEHPHPPTPGEEPYGDLDHYGPRLDGTYGPIIGTPWELSHYRKFEQLADGEVPVPATYPMLPNPSSGEFGDETERLAELFDGCYTLVLLAVERTFRSPVTDVSFFGVAFPIMQTVLPALARLLMQTPLERAADPSLGPTAGPGFAYRKRPLEELVLETETLLAYRPDLGTVYLQAWDAALQTTLDELRGVHATEVAAAP